MPYFFETLLFLLPFALYLLWRRFNPALEAADPRLLPLAVIGLVLTLAAAFWFGFAGKERPGAVYVPAERGADGSVVPGHWEEAP